jgi:hypothetical protein
MAYVELQIIVQGNGQVRARKQGGGEVGGEFRLSPLHKNLIAIFDRWLREKKISRRQELAGLGSLLYQSLFDDDVGRFFKQSLDSVTGSDRLRLQLVFHQAAADLAGVPWEFLYYPDRESQRGFFLATHPKLVLSRYIPLGVDRPDLGADEALRFLVVVSQPQGVGPVIAPPVIEAIENLSETHRITVRLLENPTIDEFIEAVEHDQPHVLHFMGHGKFDGEGSIALRQYSESAAAWVTDNTFAEYFQRFQPRLVVLHACQGGEVDFTNNFSGLAPQLIRMQIPAVVAMQYPVANDVAIQFSRAFYRALARGEPVDGAVQEGRLRITQGNPNAHSSLDFGTPVLYMNSQNGLIMPKPAPILQPPG